jgi:hypothetical protein
MKHHEVYSFIAGQQAIQEVLFFPQMKVEKWD